VSGAPVAVLSPPASTGAEPACPAPSRTGRRLEVMALVLAHVEGVPLADAREQVERALAAGARGLEVIDGCS
jgi:hypothetical protein